MIEKKDNKIIAVCAEIDIEVKIDYDIACESLDFKEKVKFDKCEFKGKVSFKNCTFKKQVIFSNSLFKNNVYFDNSTFKDYADFHESNFMSITSFYGINFQKVPNFSACYFKEQKAVNLVNVDINSLDFRKVEKFIDNNYKDKTYDNDILQNPNKPQEIEQKHRLRYAQNAKDSFRVIKDILIEQNNTLEAQEWHKLELYAKEKELSIKLKQESLQLYKHSKKQSSNNEMKNKISYKSIIDKTIFFIECIVKFIRLLSHKIYALFITFVKLLIFIPLYFVRIFKVTFSSSEDDLLRLKKEILIKILKLNRYGRNMRDYTTWANCILLQLYRNTSDHHTNFVKILNFTAIMVALYASFILFLDKNINFFMSLDSSFIAFISSCAIYITMLFLLLFISNKNNFLQDSFTIFFIIFGFISISTMTYLSFRAIQVLFLMLYIFGITFLYALFICKIKIIVFLVRIFSYAVFLSVIILKIQLVNPFIGIFSNDNLFESKFEQKLNDLNSSIIANLAKISQKEFELLPQEEYNISFDELNSAKVTIIKNKMELNNVLSFLFDEKKINNFKEILATLENNASNLPNVIKSVDNRNNNSAVFFDMRKLFNSDFRKSDDIRYKIFRDFPLLSITPRNEEYQIFELHENQNKLKNILSIIKLDNTLKLTEIKKAIDYDEILSDTIKSTSVIYSIILLLCIFSLQKTARKKFDNPKLIRMHMNNKNGAEQNPLVSILCITYNHKDYIKQCLDGFVMQKTNFKFVVYVGDDCSTDGTTEIVKEYEKKYPNTIKGIYQSQNTKGAKNFFDVANACKSKYAAWCEGDDYWIDEYKLQKQVDFLETHPDYAICFHPVKVVYEGFDFEKPDEIYPSQEMIKNGTTFDLLLKTNFIQTNSVMYRWEFKDKSIEKYFPKDILPGDWYLHLLHAKCAKIKMLPDIMSIYRRNPNGIWSDSITNMDKHFLRHGLQIINFYYCVYKNIADSSQEYLRDMFLPSLKETVTVYFHYKRFEQIQTIGEKYAKYICMMISEQIDKSIKLQKKYKKYKKLFRFNLTLSIILFIVICVLLIRI